MTRAPVRIGLAGAGRWGRNYINCFRDVPGARLAGVASRSAETATLVPDGTRVVTDWRALVSSGDVDAVIVATPPATHAEIAIAALDAGKGVLIEKPLALNVAEADAIRAAATRSGRPVLVGHTHLFHPGFVRLRAEAACHGPVWAIRSSAGNHGPYRPDVSVLWDWGAHDVAMCLALLGETPDRQVPIEVLSATRLDSRRVGGILAESIRLRLLIAANVPASLAMSTLRDRHRWFAADFDSATLIYRDRGPVPLTLHDRPGALPEDRGIALPVPAELPLTVQVKAFVALIVQGVSAHESLALGKRVVEVLGKCDALLVGT